MTPDQYRREGAEAMQKAAAEACEDYAPERHVDFPTDPFIAQTAQINHSADRIRAIDPDEVLAKVENDRCAKCGEPRSNHPYRHPFVGMGNDPSATHPFPASVARLVEAARWVINQTCEGFCRDLPSAASYEKEMDLDCGGCRVRAALCHPACP